MALAILVSIAVVVLAGTVGRRGALRAERHVGAWAWVTYCFLGLGMVFGAMSLAHPVLLSFMWTKLTAFIVTGMWLAQGRIRRREPLFPGIRRSSSEG